MNAQPVIELDDDEAAHRDQISDGTQQRLDLAYNAAVLALNGLIAAEDAPALDEPRALVSFLLAKCAQSIRFAHMGLTLGYYSVAYGILRSALDSLAHAVLFDGNPGEIATWMRDEFSSGLNAGERQRRQAERMKAAKRALLDLEEDERGVVRNAMQRFVQDANSAIHVALSGLAQQFGISFEQLVPRDLEEAFSQAEEDLDKALDLYVLANQLGREAIAHQGTDRPTQHEMVAV